MLVRTAGFVALLELLLGACTSHEGDPSSPDERPPIAFKGAIASVSVNQDCPDAESRAARVEEGAKREGDWSPPCTQSYVQLTLSHDAREAQPFTVKAARLTSESTGAQLASIPFRSPSRWEAPGHYVAWDERLPASSELKASYKLGEPDWSLIGKALDTEDTHAARYVLELDVELAGRAITLRSSGFQREYPDMIET